MDYDERSSQIEALLADLSRRMDRWDQQPINIAGNLTTLDEQPIRPKDLEMYLSDYESRMRRLEDAVFNKAS